MSRIPGTIVSPEFGSIEILRLQRGDVLVLTLNDGIMLDESTHSLIQRALTSRFPTNECLIVTDGKLSVLRPDEE